MHLRSGCRGLTTFQSLVLVALAIISAGVVYLAFRASSGGGPLDTVGREFIAGTASERADQARGVAARTDANNLTQALRLYKLDNGHYPTAAQGLNALVEKPTEATGNTKWRAYLDKLPSDPWGHAYRYKIPGRKSEVEILSDGPDGMPDTPDDIGP